MKYILVLIVSFLAICAYSNEVVLSTPPDTVLMLKKEQSVLLKKMYIYRENLMQNNSQLQRLQEEKMRIHKQMSEILREDEQMKLMQDSFNQLEAKRQAAIAVEQVGQTDSNKGEK